MFRQARAVPAGALNRLFPEIDDVFSGATTVIGHGRTAIEANSFFRGPEQRLFHLPLSGESHAEWPHKYAPTPTDGAIYRAPGHEYECRSLAL
jgi:hypothetical protein